MKPRKLTKRLGELLIDHEVITQQQLESVLQQQRLEGGRIGHLMVQMGILTEPELLGFVAEQLDLPFIDLNKVEIDPQVVKLLPEVYARRHRALVIAADDTDVTVALSDPADLDTQDAIANMLAPRQVHLAVALQSQLFGLYDQLYRRTDDILNLAGQLQGENAPRRPIVEASGLDDSDATVAKVAALPPPRFTLQLLRAGSCALLVELPTGEAFTRRDPAYLLLQDLLRAAGLPVSLIGSPHAIPPLPEGGGLAVYRVVQEALTNTLKHAGPGAEATVRLRTLTGPPRLQVTIDDTGRGQDDATAPEAGVPWARPAPVPAPEAVVVLRVSSVMRSPPSSRGPSSCARAAGGR